MIKETLNRLKERKEIEIFSKSLTPQDLLLLLEEQEIYSSEDKWKLLLLFNEVPVETFFFMLSTITERQLELLKSPQLAESIQFQLTFLSHALQVKLNNFVDEIVETEKKWSREDFGLYCAEDFSEMMATIEQYAKKFQEIHPILEKALKLAWNTDRKDLIESFSHLKERFDHLYITAIGYPESEKTKATGLYYHISCGIERVYSEKQKVLQNQDSALEGVILLGVSSLKDFKEVGLLPKEDSIQSQELEQSFLNKIQETLNSIGLHTIEDLKNKWICSKSTLKSYVLTSFS